MGIDRDIARLKAKILHNHRQIERLRQHNRRLTDRLSQIEGRDPRSVAPDDRSPGATAPKFDRHRPQQRILVWLIIGTMAIAILAIGCGCIGFAIARVLLR
jgi:type VI protein secretion system component VasF